MLYEIIMIYNITLHLIMQGKSCFSKAREVLELTTLMTGDMGKRTKYQITAHAQLYLFAKSSILNAGHSQASMVPAAANSEEDQNKSIPSNQMAESNIDMEDKPEHAPLEVGRRMVITADEKSGEEAAVREVLLDDVELHVEDNILFEGGPRFDAEGGVDKGGSLHPVDQAVILALCLDVCNSNPLVLYILIYFSYYIFIDSLLNYIMY